MTYRDELLETVVWSPTPDGFVPYLSIKVKRDKMVGGYYAEVVKEKTQTVWTSKVFVDRYAARLAARCYIDSIE